MSTNEEATSSRSASPFAGLQGAHMLPATDGGGVVFPFGFFGPVYYLPEWEFIRYASYLNQLSGHWAALSWWQRQFRGPSRLKAWIVIVIAALATFYAIRSGLLRKEMVPTVAALCFAHSFYYGIIHIYFIERSKLLTTFPSATPLPLHAYWWPHSLASLIAITKSDCFQILRRWLLRLGFAAYIAWVTARGMLHPLLAAAMIPVFVVQLIQPAVMLASLVLMRRQLGRQPTGKDLSPVEPPPGLPRA